MARKPGASRDLNIDAARIGTDSTRRTVSAVSPEQYGSIRQRASSFAKAETHGSESGRWPANVILTDPILDGGWDGVVGGGEQRSPAPYERSVDAGNVLYGEGMGARSAGDTMQGHGDTGTYSRFFLIPDTRSTALSGTMDTCPTCSASTAESPSGTRDDATSSARSPVPPSTAGPSAPGVSDAASRSLWAETSTAPRPAPTLPDGTPESTASEAKRDPIASDTRPTETSTSPAPLPATASPSDQPASPAAAPTTSTGTTTTTANRWTCGHCAAPATTGSTPQQPKASSAALLPVERPDYGRFYLQPKAPTRERVLSDGRRSPHPTQKPEALIRHLVTLVTPPDGLVLDPFLGSGTLGVVCDGLGVRWLGIEREPEYAQWAEDRIADRRPAWSAA
jgi:hypothetical protein